MRPKVVAQRGDEVLVRDSDGDNWYPVRPSEVVGQLTPTVWYEGDEYDIVDGELVAVEY